MGLYGDDCRYTKSGEKLVVLNMNILLQKFNSNFAHDQQFFMHCLFFLINLGDNTKPNTALCTGPIRLGSMSVSSLCLEGITTGCRLQPKTHIPSSTLELRCPVFITVAIFFCCYGSKSNSVCSNGIAMNHGDP